MPILEECCCGCSLKKGTILIAVFYLLSGGLQIGAAVHRLYFCSENARTWVHVHECKLKGNLGCGALQAILAIFLIVAAAREKAVLVFSWVFVSILTIITASVLGIMTFNAYLEDENSFSEAVLWITLFIGTALLSVYFLLVVYSYYELLRDTQRRILI